MVYEQSIDRLAPRRAVAVHGIDGQRTAREEDGLPETRGEERLLRHIRKPVEGPHLAPRGKVLIARLPALEEYHSVYTVLPGPGRRVPFLA